tara:strand:- start:1757 stop:1897 length:141 start_codon:yes stop_codon:yes gene_type:complete
MKSTLSFTTSNMLDKSKARELEDQALSGDSSDVADAFRAITSMVVE